MKNYTEFGTYLKFLLLLVISVLLFAPVDERAENIFGIIAPLATVGSILYIYCELIWRKR